MYPLETKGEDDSVFKMTVSGDPCREKIGYIIACSAVYFVVYHEVGHHKKGHVKKLKEKYNLYYSEAPYTWISGEYMEERKKMELEADIFVGNHAGITFLKDIKAMEWFLYQYK